MSCEIKPMGEISNSELGGTVNFSSRPQSEGLVSKDMEKQATGEYTREMTEEEKNGRIYELIKSVADKGVDQLREIGQDPNEIDSNLRRIEHNSDSTDESPNEGGQENNIETLHNVILANHERWEPALVNDIFSHCMDERQKVEQDTIDRMPHSEEVKDRLVGHVSGEKPRIKMVGGAAGFVAFFGLLGKNLDESIGLTEEMYRDIENKFGVKAAMRIHNDTHIEGAGHDHGHNHDEETGLLSMDARDLLTKSSGCGFLKILPQVMSDMRELFSKTNIPLEPNEEFLVSGVGSEIFRSLVADGAKVVPLKGEHLGPKAAVVFNQSYEYSIYRKRAYDVRPMFVVDSGKIAEYIVEFVDQRVDLLTRDQIEQILVVMHLDTAWRLGVLDLDQENPNKFANVVQFE